MPDEFPDLAPESQQQEKGEPVHHYHGSSVRTLFILAALVMVLGLAYVVNHTPVPYPVSLVAIVVLGVSAGITSKRTWSALLNVAVAVVSLLVFELYSVREYTVNGLTGFFWMNEFLSALFLLAVYFSIRTLRWMLQAKI